MWKRPLRCHKNLRTIQQLTNFGDAAVEESPPLLEKERDGPLAVVVSERTTTSRFNSIKSSRFDVKIGIKRPHSEEEEHDSCGVTSSEAHTRNTQTNENSNHSERTFVLLSSNEAGTESSTATDKSAAAVSQHDVQIPDFPVTCHGSEIGRPVVLTVTSSKSDDVNFFYDAPSPCTPLRDQTQGELRWCEKANEVTSLKPKWELSEDQKRICDIVVNQHRSVLLTGGAGTGKSHLLRAIIEALPKAKTFVTATTGLAALNLSGTTLHSFSGCGLVDQHKDTAQSVYKSISNKKKAKANWRKCSVLIVDEVSMLDAWFFDVLEYVARRIRGNALPFGGIQLVLSGDFLQLPPVNRTSSKQVGRLCFEAESWPRVNALVCMLSHHFRQKDRELFTLLNEVRLGSLSPVSLGLLSTLSVAANTSFTSEDNVGRKAQAVAGSAFPLSLAKEEHNSRKRSKGRDGFTILRARRADVDTFNTEKFDELGTEIYTYKGIHRGEGSFPLDLPETVKVRVGCRVMLLANIDLNLGLANGCVGIVESFINVNQAFNLTNSTTKEDTRALAKHEMLPVVRFDTRDNASGKSNEGEVPSCRIVTIEPHRWTTRQGEDEISCTTQIPLQLAYAITIHKSQGMSLSHVNVDFNGIFEEGQAYVALSRCTNIANLVIENFNARQVNPNVKALAYYKALDVIISKQHEEELKLVEEGHRMHPWGPYEVDGFDDESSENQPEDKQHGGHFYYDPENIACMIERCRKEFLPQYTMYSTVRRWVLSKIDAAFILSGSLLVMDTTSLLALTIPIGCGGSAYQKIFSSRGNMMRVPRVVKEELLGVIATGDTALEEELSQNLTPLPILTYSTACSNSQRTSKNFYNIIEAADKAIAIMEDAKREFLLDEQREGERAALPPVLRVWEPFSQMLMLGPDSNDCHQEEKTNVTAFCSDATPQHRSILEFARFLEGRYSTSSPVFVCTETVELAARAMAIGLRVCSVAYLCSRVK